MIAKELQYRFTHYVLLVIVMSALFAFYIFSTSPSLRTMISVLIGLTYAVWGFWTHKGEIRTMRLMLEYVAVGLLGAVILGVLAQTV